MKKHEAEVAQCSEVKGSACMQSRPARVMVKKHNAEVVQSSACMQSRSARVMVSKHESEVVQCSEVKSSAEQCLHAV